jgi:hypothetical protein
MTSDSQQFSSAELVKSEDGWIITAQQGEVRFRVKAKTREEALRLLKEHLIQKHSQTTPTPLPDL